MPSKKGSFFLTLCEIPWRFSSILPNAKISLTLCKIPWQFPDLEKFYFSLTFPWRLWTLIIQHWARWWIGTDKWPSSLMHLNMYASPALNGLTWAQTAIEHWSHVTDTVTTHANYMARMTGPPLGRLSKLSRLRELEKEGDRQIETCNTWAIFLECWKIKKLN